MNRLESMSLLITVVESGSLSAASRKLRMPLATVSRKISELESHLETRLLIRSTRKLELTDTGRKYVEACRQILEEVEEAERTASGEYAAPRGELVITAPVVFGRLHILPVVAEFLTAFPHINVQLSLTDRFVDLIEEHVDLAVRIGELPDSAMIATKIGVIREVVCGSPGYFTKHGIPKTPKDLSRHACISNRELTLPHSWIFTKGTAISAIPVRSRLIVTTVEAAVDAAVADVGVTRLLSYQIAQYVESGKLKIILREYESPPWPVQLVYLSTRALPLKVRAFLDFATPRLKTKIPQKP